jgi:hypothetical protein
MVASPFMAKKSSTGSCVVQRIRIISIFSVRNAETITLEILDFKVVKDGPVEYAKEERSKAKRDFIIAFQLFCRRCKLVDFVKVSNVGWQGGQLKNSPVLQWSADWEQV